MRHIAHQVRSATLSGYVELVNSLGRDPHAFLRSVGIRADALSDAEALIPRDAARELLEITARATKTEDLALRLAAQRKLSALGPICLVLREEPTPRAALETLCRYLRLVNTSLLIRIEDAGGMVIIREDLMPSDGLEMRQSVELAVGTMCRMLGELIGPRWRPIEVCFTHRGPNDSTSHNVFFGRRVKFNQDFNGLICSATDLSQARAPADPGAAHIARKYLEAALMEKAESMQQACRQLILALLPSGTCTANEVARHLHVDRRTLHRRLGAEGFTFSDLLDEARTRMVQHHLNGSDIPLGEIAEMLGFSTFSSFSHWFRRVFGCSASQWRRTTVKASSLSA